MTVGCKVRLGVDADGKRQYGIVVYIHPQKRFVVIEHECMCMFGNKVRETRFIGRRRGASQTTQKPRLR